MEQRRTTVQKTGTYYGIITGIVSIIYMIILLLTGLMDNVALHFMTGVILVVGVILAIKSHKRNVNGPINYLEGIGVGLFVGLIASVLFTIFQILADSVFNLAMSYPYMAADSYSEGGTIGLLAITWIIFGIVLGPFIAYIAMQFFKAPDHKMND